MINRRFLVFGVVGLLGFVIDSTLTMLLISADVSPLGARVPAILLAMCFTWLANRRVTFAVEEDPTATEAGRYVIVGLLAAALNYAIYTALVLSEVYPFIAIVIATGIVTIFSYFSYKKFAFRLNAD